MESKKFLRIILILLILALNIGCDQVSKSIVRQKMDDFTYLRYFGNHITLSKVENTGAFLSLGDRLPHPVKIVLLNLLPLLVVVIGLVFILTKHNLDRVIAFGLILVIGGGIGNLYDRIMHGSVTDFMHINFVIFQTGIFNVADLSISTGVCIMLVQAYLTRSKPATEVSNLSQEG
jgi:signal peptidase II